LSKVPEYLIDFQGKSVPTVRYRRQLEIQCQISGVVTLECDRQVQITIYLVWDAHDSLNPGHHQGNATGVLNGVMRESQWNDIGGTRPAAREFPRRRGRILRPWYNSSRSGNYEESTSIDSHKRSVESGGSTQGRPAFLVKRMMRMSDIEFERFEATAVFRGHLPKH